MLLLLRMIADVEFSYIVVRGGSPGPPSFGFLLDTVGGVRVSGGWGIIFFVFGIFGRKGLGKGFFVHMRLTVDSGFVGVPVLLCFFIAAV